MSIQSPSSQVTALAEKLRQAASSKKAIAPLRTELGETNIDGAYQVQEVNTLHLLRQGGRLVGRKIGLTSASVQKQLGVDQPDYGMLFSNMAVVDGEEIAAGRLIQPKVEAEVAFVLGRDLKGEQLTVVDIMNAVAYALPAIEIVDSRIADWKIGIVDTVADNASAALYVVGNNPTKIANIDLRLCGMVMEKKGDPVTFGAGAACLGNPLHATLWLATKMVEVGRPLLAGDVVLSGALGPMVAVAPGDRFEARISGLGSVRVGFAAEA